MATRPAYVWTGSDWDDIGDKRLGASVTALESELGSKSANPKTVDTKTANYTLVLGDRDKIIQMNNTAARTITVPTNASVAFPVGTIVHVANINTGTLTIAGASGATVNEASGLTLARWESGTLYQRAANNWVFLKGGGLGAANFSNTATGTYSSGGFNFKYVTFNASGTLTVTQEGFADVLVVGGGGSGASWRGGGGGAGGHLYATDVYLPSGSLTVTIGAGGVPRTPTDTVYQPGQNGNASRLHSFYSPGGGAGSAIGENTTIGTRPGNGFNGGSGGGGSNDTTGVGGSGTTGLGNSGGAGHNLAGGGGGGAGAAGANATSGNGGNGGAGLANSITGSSVTRAGGGGGGGTGTLGTGGSGGGGSAGSTPGAGTANTGGGGGASTGATKGGNGGSGVVIIRVKV